MSRVTSRPTCFMALKFRRAVIFIGDNGGVEGAVRVSRGANGNIGATRRGGICLAGACGEAKYSGVGLREVLCNHLVAVDVEMAMAALQSDPRSPPSMSCWRRRNALSSSNGAASLSSPPS